VAGRTFHNSLTVSRFPRRSLHSLLSPVALRSLRLLGCSMPLRRENQEFSEIYGFLHRQLSNLSVNLPEFSIFSAIFVNSFPKICKYSLIFDVFQGYLRIFLDFFTLLIRNQLFFARTNAQFTATTKIYYRKTELSISS
jgi:hypothetical protein